MPSSFLPLSLSLEQDGGPGGGPELSPFPTPHPPWWGPSVPRPALPRPCPHHVAPDASRAPATSLRPPRRTAPHRAPPASTRNRTLLVNSHFHIRVAQRCAHHGYTQKRPPPYCRCCRCRRGAPRWPPACLRPPRTSRLASRCPLLSSTANMESREGKTRRGPQRRQPSGQILHSAAGLPARFVR